MFFKKIKLDESIEKVLEKREQKLVKKLLKKEIASLIRVTYNTTIIESFSIFQLKLKQNEQTQVYQNKINEINAKLRQSVFEEKFKSFSESALSKISSAIAPQISGYDAIKKAVALQLVSKQPIHLLLIGDPGTGKTDIARSASELAPISAYGLGSGTSSAGLVVTVKGNEVIPGLLPMANDGLCVIDELNLMRKEDYAGLYNAMEKGFVTYDKGGKHFKFDARVKILATANPTHDEFKSASIEAIKKQIPFEPALLSRFHFVFIIKKPSIKRFMEITEHVIEKKTKAITAADKFFIKEYIRWIQKNLPQEPHFTEANKRRIVDFVKHLKLNEKQFVTKITPRFVVGLVRLCGASALIENRKEVTKDDVERVKNLVNECLKIQT
ncbi:hypothetical protein DRJ19_03625 [Candidatus Woesearchaeota archaeon]|nr:MAG: hypothetical protein DRJ19_03625 [Candidatus Woesearchaeota archaeon]